MSVSDILAAAAILLIASTIVAITFSYCTEYYFKRKEKHLEWSWKGVEEDEHLR